MSTRATYQINGHTFYIHHDGYPAGAAMYLNNAMEFTSEAPNATFQDDFMRANARAELTESHEAHPDTEYRYTVTTRNGEPHIKADHRPIGADGFGRIYTGPLSGFISANQELIAA